MTVKQDINRGMNPRVNNGDRRANSNQQIHDADQSIQIEFAISKYDQLVVVNRDEKKHNYYTTSSNQPDWAFTYNKSNAPSDLTARALEISLMERRKIRNEYLVAFITSSSLVSHHGRERR